MFAQRFRFISFVVSPALIRLGGGSVSFFAFGYFCAPYSDRASQLTTFSEFCGRIANLASAVCRVRKISAFTRRENGRAQPARRPSIARFLGSKLLPPKSFGLPYRGHRMFLATGLLSDPKNIDREKYLTPKQRRCNYKRLSPGGHSAYQGCSVEV